MWRISNIKSNFKFRKSNYSSGMSKGKQNAVKTLVSHGAGRKNVKDESGAGPS